MLRLISILPSLLVLALAGCGATGLAPSLKSTGTLKSAESRADSGMERAPVTTTATPTAPPAGEAAVADPVVGMARTPSRHKGPQSGILTAGSFDDNVDPQVFRKFAGKFAQSRSLGDLPERMLGGRLVVLVKDNAGKPVGEARVILRGGANTAPELLTRSDGRAVFVPSFDGLPTEQPLVLNVTPPEGGQPVTETVPPGAERWDVTLPTAQSRLPKNLDLAVVLDTTGSMGDELDYLKSEIRGISGRIKSKFPEVAQRFALVLYRDDGDEYVSRRFDFASLDEFHKHLSAQRADGGGDMPEAVHRGLEESLQLRWRDRDTARVLFLVGDAPPHTQHMGKTMAAVNGLRKRGVSIYPIACSGYDDPCELVWRSCALLTGSQFVFLTDDSGVGSGHAEPKIPYYQVERLERLMTRLIASELSGQRVQAEAADIIRTVGRKVN